MTKEKRDLVKAGLEIYERGLVSGTWGNISARLGEDSQKIAITPTGIDYREIEVNDIVILDLSENKIEGEKKPSTERKLHINIYKNREDAKAIVHTHSPFATAISCNRINIPPIVEDMVQIVGGSIETAEYKLPGTEDLAKSALKALKSKKAVLLANHGAVAIGKDLREALKVAEIIEKSAKIYIMSESLGNTHEISKEDVEIMKKIYAEKYGQ